MDRLRENSDADFGSNFSINLVSVESVIPGIKPEDEISTVDPDIGRELADFNYNRLEYFKFIEEDDDWKKEALKMGKRMREAIVVDIGMGAYPHGFLYAAATGADSYVGVELASPWFRKSQESFSDPSADSFRRLQTDLRKLKFPLGSILPKVALCHQDIVSFLRRLPQNSVSGIAGGIDYSILGNRQYVRLVDLEIFRVLNPQGAFLVYDVEGALKPQNPERSSEKIVEKSSRSGVLKAYWKVIN